MSNPAKKTRTRTKKGHARLTPTRFKVVRAKRVKKADNRIEDLIPPLEIPPEDETFMRL